MKRINTGRFGLTAMLIAFWYFVVLAIVRLQDIVPGVVASVIMSIFYLATRKSGGEYTFRYALTLAIGMLITLVMSVKLSLPLGVTFVNMLVMPWFVAGGIHTCHVTNH